MSQSEQDKSNLKILECITKYMEEAPGLRFGQILFNLNINQFADKSNPETKGYLCRDIHNDASSEILKRVKVAMKREEEEN